LKALAGIALAGIALAGKVLSTLTVFKRIPGMEKL
jgi:hypothetical protein